MDLLARLHALRTAIAREQRLPAYYIMNNDTLALLATEKPTTREEFIGIKGIGERKYERFGERFVREIRNYI